MTAITTASDLALTLFRACGMAVKVNSKGTLVWAGEGECVHGSHWQGFGTVDGEVSLSVGFKSGTWQNLWSGVPCDTGILFCNMETGVFVMCRDTSDLADFLYLNVDAY